MKLTLFSFALPAIIGYVLFIGISGKLWPLSRPADQRQRPAWLLGLWAGLSVAIVLAIALNMAYRPSSASIASILLPTSLLLATLLAPGLVAWFIYKRRIEREFDATADLSEVYIISQEMVDADDHTADFEQAVTLVDSDNLSHDGNIMLENIDIDEPFFAEDEISSHEYESSDSHRIEERAMATDDITAPANSDEYNEAFWLARNRVIESNDDTTAGRETIQSGSTRTTATWIQPEQQLDLDFDTPQVDLDENEVSTFETDPVSIEVAQLTDELASERQLREHVETHLRITRKALTNLESSSRVEETAQLNQKIELEDRLAASIRQVAVADARAERETQAKNVLEQELNESRRAVLAAKQSASKNIAARAKALKTANKAIVFARQSVDARAAVEGKVQQLKETVESQQATISSLISSLETEQAKSLEEKSFLTKQLLLKDQDVKITTASSAKEAESIASKLVQKVARSNSRVS